MINQFFYTLQDYAVDIIPSLLLGFFLSGLIHEFFPSSIIDKYLTEKGIKPILYLTSAGILLPLCCFGSLPVAVGLRKKGVALGPVLAFYVATPATSITSILVTWKLMGIGFTLYLCLTVILMGVIIGIIGNLLPFKNPKTSSYSCPMCEDNHKNESLTHCHHHEGFKKRVISLFTFGFIDIPKHIGLELVIGIILAALVASIAPLGNLIKTYLISGYAYIFSISLGLIMYICSTATVPLVHAFVNQGLNIGAGVVLLIAGPITSLGALLVFRKEFGLKIVLIYLLLIFVLALSSGYIFSRFFG